MLEIGFNQTKEVKEILKKDFFVKEVFKDLAKTIDVS